MDEPTVRGKVWNGREYVEVDVKVTPEQYALISQGLGPCSLEPDVSLPDED